MNGVLISWSMMLDERLIYDVRRHDGPVLRRIEPVLRVQNKRV